MHSQESYLRSQHFSRSRLTRPGRRHYQGPAPAKAGRIQLFPQPSQSGRRSFQPGRQIRCLLPVRSHRSLHPEVQESSGAQILPPLSCAPFHQGRPQDFHTEKRFFQSQLPVQN